MIEINKEVLKNQARQAVNLNQLEVIVDAIVDLVATKNKQYGNAWQLYGVLTPLLRIKENMFRVESMADGTQRVIYHPDIEKRLVDIVGYGLLGLAWLASQQGMELLRTLDATDDMINQTIQELKYEWGGRFVTKRDTPEE